MTTTRQPHDETRAAAARISAIVGSWPDVDVGAHRFGGVEFRLGRRELGHLHGDSHADIGFPRKVRDELVAAGRALPHRARSPTRGGSRFRSTVRTASSAPSKSSAWRTTVRGRRKRGRKASVDD
jgi:Luciferase